MLRTFLDRLLAHWGYIRVPKEAITLMQDIEQGYNRLHKKRPDIDSLQQLYKASHTITEWLKTGRLKRDTDATKD